jgi:putative acetyltransferase
VSIRHEFPHDRSAIHVVDLEAFGGRDEALIVDRLRADGLVLSSLVAEIGGVVVGHALFSRLPIRTEAGDRAAVALAPMAVRPSLQRQGIGTALCVAGLESCRELGERLVVVLGHAHFYPRFGFSPATAASLRAPFSGPEFMALELTPGAIREFEGGTVLYPPAFGVC